MESSRILARIESIVGFISNLISLIIVLTLFSTCIYSVNCSYSLPELWFIAYSDTYNSSVTICLMLYSIENSLAVLAYFLSERHKGSANHCSTMKVYEAGLIVFPVVLCLVFPISNSDFRLKQNLSKYLFYLTNTFLASWAYYALKYQKNSDTQKSDQAWNLLKLHIYSLILYAVLEFFAHTSNKLPGVTLIVKPLMEWSIIWICVKIPHSLSKIFQCYLGVVGHLNRD